MPKPKSDNPSPLTQRVEELEAMIEGLQSALETAKEAQVRALADLENFRRRQAESQMGWSKRALVGFFQKMAPNLLELSLGAMHSADETAKNTIEKFFGDLQKHGFDRIEPQNGDPIDPEQHEVLMAEAGAPGTIVRCLEIGWKFEDDVVIPAKVAAATEN